MGITDYLKSKLADLPGIDGITSTLEGGRQVIRVNGAEATVGPFASDNEIELAIRKALNMPETELLPVPVLVEPQAAPKAVVGTPIPSSGGYTPGSIGKLLQGLRDRQASVMTEVERKALKAHKALDRAAKVGNDLEATADTILAELGQFSNNADDDDGL